MHNAIPEVATLKLSEALAERAELKRKQGELAERIKRNAKCQEGEVPSEDPAELLVQYMKVSKEHSELVVRINKTNGRILLESGMSMIDALAHRDRLKSEHSLLKTLAAEATPKQDRYSKSEIKFVSAVSVSETQASADSRAQEYRKLDSMIQQANWNHDLE